MKIQHISMAPASRASELNAPALSPELMAATFARYSRSNEGLDAILAKINPDNEQESIDSIMRFVDYGHSSIADLAPLAFAIERISMYAAYAIFSLCPLGAGQESSTRYIPLDESALPHPEQVGISIEDADEWCAMTKGQIILYKDTLDDLLTKAPNPTDDSPKARRIAQNWALDRARNLLPFATMTNMVLIQSGREWARLCRTLLSSGEFELEAIGNKLLIQLDIVAPNCARHATYDKGFEEVADENWEMFQLGASMESPLKKLTCGVLGQSSSSTNALLKYQIEQWGKRVRYCNSSEILKQSVVRIEWPEMAFAEIRDLNRHRSAVKYAPMVLQGYEMAPEINTKGNHWAMHCSLMDSSGRIAQGDRSAIYWATIGHRIPFSMTMPLDKFLYMHNLRTGEGAHFHYAKHVQDAYDVFMQSLK